MSPSTEAERSRTKTTSAAAALVQVLVQAAVGVVVRVVVGDDVGVNVGGGTTPRHRPRRHTSLSVLALPSSHGVPSAARTSAAQTPASHPAEV